MWLIRFSAENGCCLITNHHGRLRRYPHGRNRFVTQCVSFFMRGYHDLCCFGLFFRLFIGLFFENNLIIEILSDIEFPEDDTTIKLDIASPFPKACSSTVLSIPTILLLRSNGSCRLGTKDWTISYTRNRDASRPSVVLNVRFSNIQISYWSTRSGNLPTEIWFLISGTFC